MFLQFAGYESTAKGVQQFKDDVQAFKPGTKNTLTLAAGYFAADMFIKAVQGLVEDVEDAHVGLGAEGGREARRTQIKDTIGPTEYPASYKYAVKSCMTLQYDADGTAFEDRPAVHLQRTRRTRSCRSSRNG